MSSAVMTTAWHLITGEYPPQPGGVSDYCRLVAAGLAAAGDAVCVWCPPAAGETPFSPGVEVRRELGRLRPADLRRAGRMLDRFPAPRRLLVQWVPQAFGCRSMNLAFCLWLWRRAALRGDDVRIMVHEPYLPFTGGSWKQAVAAVMHRMMTLVLLRAAREVWVSSRAWEACWRPYALGRRVSFDWLPVPSTIPAIEDASGVAALRERYAPPGGCLLGHFGTYGRAVTDQLLALAPRLLGSGRNASLLLLGRGGEKTRRELLARHPDLGGCTHATGGLAAGQLSLHLSACDLMVQPYPEGGVDGRRTSVMAALAHGVPVVTTNGRLTEPLWAEGGAVALADDGDINALGEQALRLLDDPAERARLGAAGRSLYRGRFAVEHSVRALRGSTCASPS
jgi:glycosyltransferase involved in cell wall biosynthesis